MLKKLFLILTCLLLSFSGYAAQLSATLQSGENLTPFYGSNALVDALAAAVDGDIITLSPGQFNTTEITKSVTVIGSYGFGDDTSKASWLGSTSSGPTVSADNVTLEGVRAYSINIKATQNLSINRSEITILQDSENGDKKYHNNTIITDCLINRYEAMSLSKNTVLRNCCINYFSDRNESANPALIEHCNIPIFHKYNYADYRQPYAIYRNCFLGLYKYASGTTSPSLSFNSPTEFHSVSFYNNYKSSEISSDSKAYTLNYGSCVTSDVHVNNYGKYNVGVDTGVYKYNSFSSGNSTEAGVVFGPVDHKDKPAFPAITSSEISTETDAEGKLHVKITAEARD